MTDGHRWVSVDCTRALCMLYIIGIHHMTSYIRPGTIIRLLANHATPVLCTFTAISAFFLGRRRFENRADIAAFYKSRLLRIYPLYLLGCITLFIASMLVSRYFTGPGQLALTLAGLSMLIGPAPKTMWYMSMLLLFWMVTPAFLYLKRPGTRDVVLRFAALAVWIFVLYGLYRTDLQVDGRLLPYSLVYFSVLILSDRIMLDDRPRALPVLVAAAVWAIVGLTPLGELLPGWLCRLLQGCVGVVVIQTLGQICAQWRPLATLLQWISYASMVAYLFHRQWFGVWCYAIGPLSLPLAALLLAAFLAISWVVQWIFSNRLSSRTKT